MSPKYCCQSFVEKNKAYCYSLLQWVSVCHILFQEGPDSLCDSDAYAWWYRALKRCQSTTSTPARIHIYSIVRHHILTWHARSDIWHMLQRPKALNVKFPWLTSLMTHATHRDAISFLLILVKFLTWRQEKRFIFPSGLCASYLLRPLPPHDVGVRSQSPARQGNHLLHVYRVFDCDFNMRCVPLTHYIRSDSQ